MQARGTGGLWISRERTVGSRIEFGAGRVEEDVV